MVKTKLRPISLKEVKVTDRFWANRIKQVAEEVIPYQWDALNDNIPGADPSHAIENFRITAGEVAGDFHGMVWQDSDVAKWIEAASYSLESFANPDLEKTIDDLIDLMGKAQQPDGYLNTYYSVAKPQDRWQDFAFGHELYCAGHLIEAAVAYFKATGKRKFLDIMCRYMDYVDTIMGPEEHKKKTYCGHEEIELALVKLYRATNEERYLKLSQYFINERGKQPSFLVNDSGYGNGFSDQWFELDYHQAQAPVREQKKAEGHAVRAMYLYMAMADLAYETNDQSLLKTLLELWENVTKYRMYITGGLGSQGHAERFTFDYDLPNDTAYAETCATIGLIFWAQRMLLLNPESCFADIMEKALYNGALSGISLDGLRYFYVNPLEVLPEAVNNRYDHKHVKTERQQWFGCACCPPNIARLITSLGQYIYTQNDSELYIHLFIGSKAQVIINGNNVLLAQESNYPWEGNITINVQPENPVKFTIGLRIPGWCRKYHLKLNGETLNGIKIEQGYAKINRLWQTNDRIELILEMPVELVQANPKVREDYGKIAIQRGPLIYCLEELDNGKDLWTINLATNTKFTVEFADDLFGGIAVIKGEAGRIDHSLWGDSLYGPVLEEQKPFEIMAVPYYLWGNRKPGEMLVWITKK